MLLKYGKPMFIGFIGIFLSIFAGVCFYNQQQINRLTDDDVVDLFANKAIGSVWLGAGAKNIAITDHCDQRIMKRQIFLRKKASETLVNEPKLESEIVLDVAQAAPYLVSITWREHEQQKNWNSEQERSLEYVVANTARCPASHSTFKTTLSNLGVLVCLPEIDLTQIMRKQTNIQVTTKPINIEQDTQIKDYLIAQRLERLVTERIAKQFRSQSRVAQLSQFMKSKYM